MMKKIFVIGMMFLMMGSAAASAETAGSDEPVALKKKEAKLVTINSSSARVNQLERRIDTLERALHEQNDAIRNLERDMSDLRRRR